MNDEHLALCSSDVWREIVTDQILPWALSDIALGPDVVEVGPGPGLTTDILRSRVAKLTAVEIDSELAAALAQRLAGTNVDVINADATHLPLESHRFTAAVSFTMLHHVPSAASQDQLFAELARVLAKDGVLVLSDSVASDELRALHDGDIYNPVDPTTLLGRLTFAGFNHISVKANDFGFVAHARKP